jgi:hypothetical protein
MDSTSDPAGAVRGWRRLWALVGPEHAVHAVDSPTLGEYAALSVRYGSPVADLAFPAVAQHLAAGCSTCVADLHEMQQVLDEQSFS